MTKEVRVVANWKMHKTIDESLEFVQKLDKILQVSSIAMPTTSLYACAQKKPPMVSLGAQNIHFDTSGPYTGEVSAEMVRDAGADFVILGHSERRHLFHEDNLFINKKIKHALLSGLQVILCIGETLTERESGTALEVLKKQLLESLFELTDQQLEQITIAYEPVWAIGTGVPATAQMAQETHSTLRKIIHEQWGQEVAENIYILHGGSIKPDNVEELTLQPDIDGVLVGGASLQVDSFMEIIEKAGKIKK